MKNVGIEVLISKNQICYAQIEYIQKRLRDQYAFIDGKVAALLDYWRKLWFELYNKASKPG